MGLHQGGEAQGPGEKEKVACVAGVWEREGVGRAERGDGRVSGVPGERHGVSGVSHFCLHSRAVSLGRP